MALAQATKSRETTYTINDAMDVLLSKLDEAIDDMENGRVQTVKKHGQKLMQYKGYGWKKRKYKVVIAQSGKLDVKEKRNISFSNLSDREYAENFSKKIKKRFLHLIHFRPGIIQQASGIVVMIFT